MPFPGDEVQQRPLRERDGTREGAAQIVGDAQRFQGRDSGVADFLDHDLARPIREVREVAERPAQVLAAPRVAGEAQRLGAGTAGVGQLARRIELAGPELAAGDLTMGRAQIGFSYVAFFVSIRRAAM